ncbi:MAG TPA: YwqG family protein [Anaerolineaceae bacterium]
MIQSLSSANLNRIAPDVNRLAVPSIRIVDVPGKTDGDLRGRSHLGGRPDLPSGAQWPTWKGAPMAFVAQLRLEEVAPFDTDHRLPNAGMLSFFYDSSQETYGADPDDRGGWQVVYNTGDLAAWQPLAFPAGLGEENHFQPVGVSFAKELTLPSAPLQVDPRLTWSDDEIKRYENWLVDRFSPAERGEPHNRVFGEPDQIQDDMRSECALAANGFRSPTDPGAAEAVQAKMDWTLLLQVDSDANAKMRWGSAGMIYFWITQAALKDKHFDQTWLVMQSD